MHQDLPNLQCIFVAVAILNTQGQSWTWTSPIRSILDGKICRFLLCCLQTSWSLHNIGISKICRLLVTCWSLSTPSAQMHVPWPWNGTGWLVPYRYMQQLKQLKRYRCTPLRGLPTHLPEITMLLRDPAWKQALNNHLDKEFAEYIVQGITNGFHIGFNYVKSTCQAAGSNFISAD